MQKQPI